MDVAASGSDLMEYTARQVANKHPMTSRALEVNRAGLSLGYEASL